MQTSGLKVKILDRFSPKVCISRCVIGLLYLVDESLIHADLLGVDAVIAHLPDNTKGHNKAPPFGRALFYALFP